MTDGSREGGRHVAPLFPGPAGMARGSAAVAACLCSLAVFGALAAGLAAAWQPPAAPRSPALTVVRFSPRPRPARPAPSPAVDAAGGPHLAPARPPAPAREVPPTGAAPTPSPAATRALEAVQPGLPDATAAPPVPPPSAPPIPRSADAEWDAYQAQVSARIAARKPRGVHLAGEAVVAFELDRGGRLSSAALAHSSGNAMLDQLALRTIRAASPYPPPAAALRERPLAFEVRFSFH